MQFPSWLLQAAAQKRGRVCSCAAWKMGAVRGMLHEVQHSTETLHST